jgi:energy-coupling factor transport system substrate-specific component
MKKRSNSKITAFDLTLMAMMVAVIEVSKVALANIPNVELTSFWIIMFTLFLGKHIFFVIPVFTLIEGAIYGFGIWWVMYLYAWPMLAFVTFKLRKLNTAWDWAIVSGIFGLLFGLLCALPYLFVSGVPGMITWWIAGIPFDLIHGTANFFIMLILYKPMRHVMTKVF